MKIIDVDALLAQMQEYYEKRAKKANMTGDRIVCVTWNDAVFLIKSAPTVDAMPVVRCKDCRYGTDYYRDGDCYCKHENLDYIGNWNHYCSYAKRKEE